MTKVHPVQIACALRACTRFLAGPNDYNRQTNDNTEFVCWALDTAARKGLCSIETAEAVKHMIEERLYPANNVQAWQVNKGHLSYGNTTERSRFRMMQEYRHRWVESMAKEHFALGENISKQLREVGHV